MGLGRGIVGVLLLTVIADLTLCGQENVQPKECGPVCAILCEHGNVMKDGCPTCQCKPSPTSLCPPTSPPVFPERRCLWGSSDNQCGKNEFCFQPTTQRTGICCRRQIAPPDKKCPVIDMAGCEFTNDKCITERDCPSGQKCCPTACGNICVGAGYFPGFPRFPLITVFPGGRRRK